MNIFRYFKSLRIAFCGRVSAREYTVIFVIAILLLLGFCLFCRCFLLSYWETALALPYLSYLIYSATIRRAHDAVNQKIDLLKRPNWPKLFYQESDPGENEYGPEPWDSQRNLSKSKE